MTLVERVLALVRTEKCVLFVFGVHLEDFVLKEQEEEFHWGGDAIAEVQILGFLVGTLGAGVLVVDCLLDAGVLSGNGGRDYAD